MIRYSSELGLELDEYNALSAVARNEFLRLFASGIVNRTTPSEQTKEYMLLAKFNSEKSWPQCRDLIINDYKDFLSADVDKYNKYMAISDMNAYLKHVYGDYMQLPPKEQQVPKHDFEAIYWK